MAIRRILSALVVLAAVSFLVSCSGTRQALQAERPKDEPFRTELKKEMSTLNLGLETSADELARMLNQMVGKELYKGSTSTKGVTAEIVRTGPIAVRAADNCIYLTLPVSTSLSYSMFRTPAFTSKLKFRLGARVSPDWKVTCDIAYLGLSDLFAEEVGIGPLSIRPRSIVEGATQPVQRLVSEAVSRKINETFQLKAQAERAWRAAHKPVLLDRNYNAWLKLVPQEVLLYPPVTRENRVAFAIGITSYAEVVVGPEPAAQKPTPLPNLKLVNGFDRNFRVALNAELYYKDILNIVSPLLVNREFETDGKKVLLKEFDLYGNGEKLIVKVVTQGSLEGTFYLTCRPQFDPATNQFHVRDVDFDMNTQSLLLQSADWFLHGTIRSVIQEKLNVDLTQRLEQSRLMAQKAVDRVGLVENVFLKGTVNSLKFREAIIQKDKISLQVYSEGETALVLQ